MIDRGIARFAGTSVGDLVYLSEQFEWTVRSVDYGVNLPNVE